MAFWRTGAIAAQKVFRLSVEATLHQLRRHPKTNRAVERGIFPCRSSSPLPEWIHGRATIRSLAVQLILAILDWTRSHVRPACGQQHAVSHDEQPDLEAAIWSDSADAHSSSATMTGEWAFKLTIHPPLDFDVMHTLVAGRIKR
jgi:hypothetical protein